MSDKENKYSIRDWSEDDQPRQKLKKLGELALSDAELLAIILGSGSRDQSAVELARALLLHADNEITKLAKFSLGELMAFHGIGPAKAVSIKAAFELGRRSRLTGVDNRKSINTSTDAYELIQRDLCHQSVEECWVAFLNQANRLITKRKMSSGGLSATIVDVRTILSAALELKANGVILYHNHPSGNLSPSQADVAITKKLNESCKLLSMQLLDHLIVTPTSYYSFRDEGHF